MLYNAIAVSDCAFCRLIHLHDELGNKVFVASTGYMDKRHHAPAGLFSTTCQVPPDLMLQGTYTISRLLLVQNRGSIVFEHADSLTFEIAPRKNDDLGWMGNKEGVVLPKLNWKVKMNEAEKI